jgi:hypothetical protein
MDNFIDIEQFKESLIKEEDKIIEEKGYLFDQIKKLEFEENLLKSNLKFFERYLSLLEGGKSEININDFNIKQKIFDKYTTNDEDTDEYKCRKKRKYSEDNYLDDMIKKEFN